MSLKVIKYTNSVAIEATWTDNDGNEPRVTAYSGDQMQMFRDDVATYGGDISEWEALIAEVEAEWVPPPPVPTPVPASITMRQCRLQLLAIGKLDAVDQVIAGIEPPEMQKRIQIEWEYASTVERGSEWVAALAPALGLSDAQLDDLFVAASAL